MNVGLGTGQANGLRIGDEMNFVTAASEFQAEFSGDHTAAAVSWITGDADLHAPPGHYTIGFAGMVGDARQEF